MARVPYVDPDSELDELADLYDSTRRMIGRVPNFHRILGHLPETYRWYLPFQFSLQHDDTGSYLTPELRSLAHLATSVANRCAYCSAHNATSALERGLDPAKVAWLDANADADPDLDVFDEQERLAILWSRAVTKNEARRAMALFGELESQFSHQQIVERTVIVAARTFTNLIQEALWTDHEDGDPPSGAAPDVEDAASRQPRAKPREALGQHAHVVARQLGSPERRMR